MAKAKAESLTITGQSQLTSQQLGDYVLMNNPFPAIMGISIYQLADLYLEIGSKEGIRGDAAFAQAIHETGYFAFGGDVIPAQNNYAGIGTVGGGVKGAFFATPEEGVRAHIQHLKAYASTLPLETELADPRFSLVRRGVAEVWTDLNGKWAVPGNNYGQNIMTIYSAMASMTLTIPNVTLPSGHSLPVGMLYFSKDVPLLSPNGIVYKWMKRGSTARVYGVIGKAYDTGGGYTIEADSSKMAIAIGRALIKKSDTYLYGPDKKISRKIIPGEALRVYSFDEANYYVGGGYYVPKSSNPTYFVGTIKLGADTVLYDQQGNPNKTLAKGDSFRVYGIEGKKLDLGNQYTITYNKALMTYSN
ncbi:glucosaminidase domain-containing protein [Metabacillus sp. GX 13764]|uniref:glucosaminidase domain-containing protein n=1 Tax=Metabacillus kandeliae TaxID=2900151 RepID=UPI001E4AE9C3|nr:glucosaminidase domain-containing protein [Metabacillus kandeliae]MCD7035787.1 glucosaminidase domain-containing protein [Metabacillus kandeliae]